MAKRDPKRAFVSPLPNITDKQIATMDRDDLRHHLKGAIYVIRYDEFLSAKCAHEFAVCDLERAKLREGEARRYLTHMRERPGREK